MVRMYINPHISIHIIVFIYYILITAQLHFVSPGWHFCRCRQSDANVRHSIVPGPNESRVPTRRAVIRERLGGSSGRRLGSHPNLTRPAASGGWVGLNVVATGGGSICYYSTLFFVLFGGDRPYTAVRFPGFVTKNPNAIARHSTWPRPGQTAAYAQPPFERHTRSSRVFFRTTAAVKQ